MYKDGMDTWQLATEGYALLEMRLRQEEFPISKRTVPSPWCAPNKQQRILGALRQNEELLPKLTGRVYLAPHRITQPESPEGREQPWDILDLLAQLTGSRIGLFHLWRGFALCGDQR